MPHMPRLVVLSSERSNELQTSTRAHLIDGPLQVRPSMSFFGQREIEMRSPLGAGRLVRTC